MLPKKDVEMAIAEMMLLRQNAARIIRSAVFFVLAALLISTNSYGLKSLWATATAIGLFGLLGRIAWIGQLCLAILAVMAVIPLPTIQATLGAAQ